MAYWLVVLTPGGLAEVVEVLVGENPNAVAEEYVVLDSYSSKAQAEQRRDVENDPVQREAFISGQLKIPRSN